MFFLYSVFHGYLDTTLYIAKFLYISAFRKVYIDIWVYGASGADSENAM
ncbi:hypothetical protein STSR3_40 [Salmonella virus STSR3]|nr:hypothetical protein STSR3_40 [Salmonella virus STSR3]